MSAAGDLAHRARRAIAALRQALALDGRDLWDGAALWLAFGLAAFAALWVLA